MKNKTIVCLVFLLLAAFTNAQCTSNNDCKNSGGSGIGGGKRCCSDGLCRFHCPSPPTPPPVPSPPPPAPVPSPTPKPTCNKYNNYGGSDGCAHAITCKKSQGTCGSGCWGVSGNGKCTACNPGFYGVNCHLQVSCLFADHCEEHDCYGIGGSGICTTCPNDRYGTNCANSVSCNLSNGICTDGMCSGISSILEGKCDSCRPGFFGENCNQASVCENGECFQDTCWGISPNVTGVCTTCTPGYYGPTCDKRASCNLVYAQDGAYDLETGRCLACKDNNFGPTCSPVTCEWELEGNCLPSSCSGLSGNGTCSSCNEGYIGRNCQNSVGCNLINGYCKETDCYGINNLGECSSCKVGYFGKYCENESLCKDGSCGEGTCWGITGNGTCDECPDGLSGDFCTEGKTTDGVDKPSDVTRSPVGEEAPKNTSADLTTISLAGGVIASVLAVIGVVVLKRRKKNNDESFIATGSDSVAALSSDNPQFQQKL